MALSRAVRSGHIQRLAQGIYFIPSIDPVLGELMPSPEAVAEQPAEREKVRIRPAGSFALHRVGLTSQVPTRLVYLTDGHPRKLKIGKASVEFKATAPKKMALSGKISGLLILALESLELALFSTPHAPHCLFKGGTSLSKGWKIMGTSMARSYLFRSLTTNCNM